MNETTPRGPAADGTAAAAGPRLAGAPRPGRVAGKVALVTGAASGIGRATALLLAREGAIVMASDRDAAGAEGTAAAIRELGVLGYASQLNVTSEENWKTVIGALVKSWGSLDVLVNNAGIAYASPLEEMTVDSWRAVLAVNLEGVFLGTKHAVVAMRASGRGGSIINISSVSGHRASPGASAYCASKAGVRLFSKAVALECAQRGDDVRVNCVLPGAVQTPIWEKLEFWRTLAGEAGAAAAPGAGTGATAAAPGEAGAGSEAGAAWRAMAQTPSLKRAASPEEVAQAILYLASDESRAVTGSDLAVDGGITA